MTTIVELIRVLRREIAKGDLGISRMLGCVLKVLNEIAAMRPFGVTSGKRAAYAAANLLVSDYVNE